MCISCLQQFGASTWDEYWVLATNKTAFTRILFQEKTTEEYWVRNNTMFCTMSQRQLCCDEWFVYVWYARQKQKKCLLLTQFKQFIGAELRNKSRKRTDKARRWWGGSQGWFPLAPTWMSGLLICQDSFTPRMLPQQKPDNQDSGREDWGRLDTCNQILGKGEESPFYIPSQGRGKMGQICQLIIQKMHWSKSNSAPQLTMICHLMSSSCRSEASACLLTWPRPDS